MACFFMFGSYSTESIKQISGERTRTVCKFIEDAGGRVKEIYALLGEYDLVFIVELPNMTDAMKASIALGQATGISFNTSAAIPVEEFDQMVEQP